MTRVHASAPGKALVTGEYVVLTGAPAISMALDRRVCVSVVDAAGKYNEVVAPGFVDGRWYFEYGPGARVRWHNESAAGLFHLFEAVWLRCGLSSSAALSISIDSRKLTDTRTGKKLGLGSSSAVAVALTAALSRAADSRFDVLSVADAAHREFQRGHGSGTDIASCFHGGVIEYRMGPGKASVPVGWPDGLAYRFFWSGNSAATTDQLRKYLPVVADRAELPSHLALGESAARVTACWSHSSAAAIFAALADYATALKAFSDECKLEIFAAGHQQMADLASECGIVYKPCGAGGGDVGIALSLDELRLDNFTADAAQAGFRQLDVRAEWRGLLIDSENED